MLSRLDGLRSRVAATAARGGAGPRRRWRRAGLVAALLLLAGLGGLAVAQRPLTVDVAHPQAGALIQVYGLGTIEARVVSRIGFDVSGTLIELAADHGDRPKQGAVLARLDPRSQEARLQQALAAVAQAKASVREAEAGRVRADATLAQSRRTSERKQSLVRNDVVSAQSAEDAKAAVDTAAADLQKAAAQVEVARANVEAAEALARVEADALAKHTLVAPYDALVIARRYELGTAVRAGDPLFTIMDPASFWILAYVDEARAGDLALHAPAAIRLRSQPGRTFHGEVVRIDIENDRVSEERKVYVRCADCGDDQHLGEQAEVVITTGQAESALLVPLAAVEQQSEASGLVWTLEDGRIARRSVALGRRTLDGRIELSGLPGGARVVTAPLSRLDVGRRARPADGGAP